MRLSTFRTDDPSTTNPVAVPGSSTNTPDATGVIVIFAVAEIPPTTSAAPVADVDTNDPLHSAQTADADATGSPEQPDAAFCDAPPESATTSSPLAIRAQKRSVPA